MNGTTQLFLKLVYNLFIQAVYNTQSDTSLKDTRLKDNRIQESL